MLSKFIENDKQHNEKPLKEVINFITHKIPKSKIIVIGGSDEVCKAIYDANCFDQVIHLDS